MHCPRWALRLNHLPGSHPPASLPPVGGWAGPQPANSPLVFTQFFVLWKSELELFVGKLSLSLFFFPLLSLAILQVGLLSHLSSLRLSPEHSGLVPTLRMQPAPPCSGPTRWGYWATNPQIRHVFCGIFFFISQLCCPLRFQNFSQIPW